MTKWADKLIDGVAYNSHHTHIEYVSYRLDNGDTVSDTTYTLSRRDVIAQIKAGVTFCTIFRNAGKWNLGAQVMIVTIGGEEFIKTVSDSTKKDNLENLPELGSSGTSRSL